MRYDRIAPVDDRRVVAPLIEHAHIDAENVGYIDRASHASLVRADGHEMILVDLDVLLVAKNVLDELICRTHRLKAGQRDRVLNTRVVRVECDNIIHAECFELLKDICAVERLASASNLLSAFVEIRHDDIDPVSFSAGGSDDALEILKMIVRRHDIIKTAHLVCERVIAYVDEDVEIIAADSFLNCSFAFA